VEPFHYLCALCLYPFRYAFSQLEIHLTSYVFCRVTPKANQKLRPEWFSKTSCLNSLAKSSEIAKSSLGEVKTVLILDVANGEIKDSQLQLAVNKFDIIQKISSGSASKSWRKMLSIAQKFQPDDSDLVYFVEDDHLHLDSAVSQLQNSKADLRFLYASPQDLTTHSRLASPATWVEVSSGVSSFAMSGKAFNKYSLILRFFSYGGGSWDELICRSLGKGQISEYGSGIRYITWPLRKESPWNRKVSLGAVRHTCFRFLAVLVGRFNNASLEAVVPSESTHCEIAHLDTKRDWALIASQNLQ